MEDDPGAGAGALQAQSSSLGFPAGNSSNSSSSRRSSHSSGSETGDGEDTCRICRCGSEPGHMLFHPCKCSGSIKFVHQDCLMQWLSHSGNRHCEVCKHEFVFTPVYAENAPPVLSSRDILLGLSAKLRSAAHLTGRVALVFAVWLVFLPQVTCMASRLAFSRTLEDAASRVDIRRAPLLIVSDCLLGSLLSAVIVTGFTLGTGVYEFFRDYFANYWGNAPEDGREVPARPRGDGFQAGNEAAEGEEVPLEGDALLAAIAAENRNPAWAREVPLVGARAGGGANWGVLGPGMPRIDANFADAERLEEPFGELMIEDLIGLRGPISHLLENAAMVTVFNVMVIAAVVCVPFNIGRMTVYAAETVQLSLEPQDLEWLQRITSLNVTTLSTFSAEPPMPAAKDAPLPDATAIIGPAMEGPEEELEKGLVSLVVSSSETLLTDLQEQFTLPTEPDRNLVILGYCVTISLLVLHLVTREIHRTGHHWRQGVRGIEYAIQISVRVVRWTAQSLLQVLIVLKVSAVMVLERGLMPLFVGWWLDICALPITDSTIGTRLEMINTYPLSSAGMHWFLGLAYMLYVSTIVAILKHSLAPDLLPSAADWFHIPADDQPDFLHLLMEERVGRQMKRLLGMLVVYMTTLVWAVHFPVVALTSLLPQHFPFRQQFSNPTTAISVDVLLFHVLVPLTMENIHGAGMMRALRGASLRWLRALAALLGLEDAIAEPEAEGAAPGGGEPPRGEAPRSSEAPASRGARHPLLAWALATLRGCDRRLRLAAAALSSVGVLMLLNVLVLLLPVSCGRAALWACRLPMVHDLYAAILGCYVLWGGQRIAAALWSAVLQHNLLAAARFVWLWTWVLLEAVALFVLLAGVVPLLVGVLLELLFLPVRVPANKSPVLFLYQDWVLGLLVVKLWHRAVVMGQLPGDLPHEVALAPPAAGPPEAANADAHSSWRDRFTRLSHSAFNHETMVFAWEAIAAPLLLDVATALALPYALSRAVLPALHVVPLRAMPYVHLYAYHITAATVGLAALAFRFKAWVTKLHNSIRDERYLVGQQLNNFPHHRGAAPEEAA